MLEGIGLAPETIRACYGRHPLEEEEAVQDGLIKWAEGHHGYSCTWRVLLSTMEYAGVAQHHCQGLKEELYEKLAGIKTLDMHCIDPALLFSLDLLAAELLRLQMRFSLHTDKYSILILEGIICYLNMTHFAL